MAPIQFFFLSYRIYKIESFRMNLILVRPTTVLNSIDVTWQDKKKRALYIKIHEFQYHRLAIPSGYFFIIGKEIDFIQIL